MIALTRKQMEHLEKIGFNTGDANMYYWLGIEDELCYKDKNIKFTKNQVGKWCLNGKEMCVPTYTLDDILSKLPNIITWKNKKYYFSIFINGFENKTIGYRDEKLWAIKHSAKDSLLEMAYEMLLWCVEKGFIKLNLNETR